MSTSKNKSFDDWLKKQIGYKNCIDIFVKEDIKKHLHEILYIKPDTFHKVFKKFSDARYKQISLSKDLIMKLYNKISLSKENKVINDIDNKANLVNLYKLFALFGYTHNDNNANKVYINNLIFDNILSIYLNKDIKLIEGTQNITLKTFIKTLYPSRDSKKKKQKKYAEHSYAAEIISYPMSGVNQIDLNISSWYDPANKSTPEQLLHFLILWEFIYYSLYYTTRPEIPDEYSFKETNYAYLMDVKSNKIKGDTVEKNKRAHFIINEEYLKYHYKKIFQNYYYIH